MAERMLSAVISLIMMVLMIQILMQLLERMQQAFAEIIPPPEEEAPPSILYPEADSYVKSYEPDVNSGTIKYIATAQKPEGIARGFLRFDLSELSGVTIKSAILHIKTYESIPTGYSWMGTVDVHKASDDWDEDTVTWNTDNPTVGDKITSINADGPDKWIEIDVTDYIKEELAGDKKATILFKHPTEDKSTTVSAQFYSKDADEKTNRPYLELTYQ